MNFESKVCTLRVPCYEIKWKQTSFSHNLRIFQSEPVTCWPHSVLLSFGLNSIYKVSLLLLLCLFMGGGVRAAGACTN